MGKRQGWQRTSQMDGAWWMTFDEEYWRALLEQGEVASENTSAGPRDTLPPPSFELPNEARTDHHSPDPMATLHPGDLCRGTVTHLTSFGAFVELGGVEGLIHVSEMSWDRVRHPSDLLRAGMEVQAQVLGVNPEQGRIALSLKRLKPNPWAQVEDRYRVGQVLEGTVTNVVNFGAFVRVEEGLEGLIHISELADASLMHPRNAVREGDCVQVRVLTVDAGRHRLGLSLRLT